MSKIKIGILTYYRVRNYGAILQAFGLFKWLKVNTDADVEIVDYTHQIFLQKLSNRIFLRNRGLVGNVKHFLNYFVLGRNRSKSKGFKEFLDHNFELSESVMDISSITEKYDLIIVGSDQVWNPEYTKGKIDKNFLIPITDHKVKRISYASSAGSWKFQKDQLMELVDGLKNFDAISVREETLKHQLDQYLPHTRVVLDPTFLLSKAQWNKSFKLENARLNKENYVLIYTFDDNPLCFQTAKKVADKLGVKVFAIASTFFKNPLVDKHLTTLSPSDFLSYFYNAEYVVTNSFHGACFSVNFGKKFLAIRKDNNPVRVENMLSKFGLSDRLVSSLEEVDTVINSGDNQLHSVKELDILREQSEAFLRENI